MENLIWVLGAPDPEMEAIEVLLRECGQTVTYATINGRRVTPAEAYRADVISGETVRVECSWDGATGPICDHHNPGDPGYGRPPADYWDASSIGQVVAILQQRRLLPWHWEEVGGQYNIPPELFIVAAADHCLAAAYRGDCPGVDPDALMQWRAESRAKFQNRHPQAVLADVSAAVVALMAAPEVVLDSGGPTGAGPEHGYDGPDRHPDVVCRDMRGVTVPELPEASARLGMCFISTVPAGRDGRVKVVCQSGTPEQIEAFMCVFAPSIGLVDIYGDPARGFAGGYHPASE